MEFGKFYEVLTTDAFWARALCIGKSDGSFTLQWPRKVVKKLPNGKTVEVWEKQEEAVLMRKVRGIREYVS